MSDDHSADIHTAGTVAVGGSATGTIESAGDRDWFAVELVAGRTYQLDLQGSPTGHGTLADTFLRRILDAEGIKSHGDGAHRTYNDDFGGSVNSRVTFTALEGGTYYVETSGDRDETGTYTLSVSDVTPQTTPPEEESPPPAPDPDAVREGAVDLGDITSLDSVMFPRHSLDGEADAVDYFRFTLSEAKRVGLGLRQLDAAADLVVEDAEGEVLHRAEAAGTANEWISTTLLAGTYYVRVESGAAGQNDYVLRYGVSAADPDEVTALEGALESGPAIRVSDAQAHEEDGVLRFRVTLSEAASGAVTVRYETVAGTAVAGEDYESVSDVLEFEAGQTEKWVEVTLVDDTEEDGGETLTLRLSDAAGGHVEVAEAVGTILNTETPTSVSEPGGEDFDAANTTAGRVLAGETVTGAIASAGDVDWYAVELEAGTTYRVDLLGSLMGGGTLLDPYLRGIYDAEQNLLSGTENDNRNLFFYSSRVEFMPEADATYYIAAGGNGSHTGTYSLSVEAFADDYAPGTNTDGSVAVDGTATGEVEYDHDRDWFAVEVEAGKTYLVDVEGTDTGQGTLGDPWLWGIHDSRGELVPGTMDDDGGEGRNARAAFMPDTSGTYYVVASAFNKGTYRVSVTDITDVYAGDASTVGAVEVGGTATGCIELAGDRDWFAVTLEGGQHYRIELEGADTGQGTLSDPRVYGIHDSQSELLAGTTDDDGGEGRNGRVDFAPQADGTYYVSAGGDGTHTGTYRLAVKPRPWELSVSDVEAHESSEEMRFRVVLSWESPTPVTVRYETVAGTAVAGEDYESASEVLTFAPGETEKWVGVRIYDDFVEDSGETLTLRLSEATGAVVVDSEATGTILNEEEPPATPIAVGRTKNGDIWPSDDRDWFVVTLEAGQDYLFEMKARGSGFFDPMIYGVYDELRNLQPDTTNNNWRAAGALSWDSRVFFKPQSDGVYHVETGSAGSRSVSINGDPADTGKYAFSVTAVVDDYSADTDTTGTVVVGGSVRGKIDLPHDQDWFAVELEADTAYRFEQQGEDWGHGTLVDPRIRGIHDSQGTYLNGTTNDQAPATRAHAPLTLDAAVYFAPDTAGTYYVAAGSSDARTGTYRVSVTEIADDHTANPNTSGAVTVGGSVRANLDYAGDTDWFEVTLTGGQQYRIDLECDWDCESVFRGVYDSDGSYISGTYAKGAGGRPDTHLYFSPDSDGTYYLAASADDDYNCTGVTGPYRLSVEQTADDYLANTATTGTVAVGGSATGEIEWSGDHDWFAVDLVPGTTYQVYLEGSETGAGTLRDPYLHGIHDINGDIIAGTAPADDARVHNARLLFTVPEVDTEVPNDTPEDVTFHISAGSGSGKGTYKLSVQEGGSWALGVSDAQGHEEDGVIRFRVALDWAPLTPVTVRYQTVDDTAVAGEDYEAASGVLTFAAGETEKWVEVTLTDDTEKDRGETFGLRLSEPTGAVLGDAQGVGTIHDAETPWSDPEPAGTDFPADATTGGQVLVGESVTGNVDRTGDKDWFAVVLEADKSYRIDLKGRTTHGTLWDPVVRRVVNADGEDQPGSYYDNYGWYYGFDSRAYLTPDESGTYYIEATGRTLWWHRHEGTYTLSVTDITYTGADDYAAGPETAGRVSVGGSTTGNIETWDDRDWFAVELEAGKGYRFDLDGSDANAGTLLLPELHGVHHANGDATPGEKTYSRMYFTAKEAGTYYVEAGGSWHLTGTYKLSVTELADDFTAGIDTAGVVAVGGTATGEVGYELDRDWFEVVLDADVTYRFDLKGRNSNSGTLGNPYLYGIHDADGTMMAGTTNNDGGSGRNSRVYFTPREAGTYYVEAGGYVHLTGTYTLSVSELGSSDDYAANTGTSATVDVGGSLTGQIEESGDKDWFAVVLEAGVRYRIDLEGSPTGRGTLPDPFLRRVVNADGEYQPGTFNDDHEGSRNSRIHFTPDESGTYYIEASGDRDEVGTYTLSVVPASVSEPAGEDLAADTTTAGKVVTGQSATGNVEAAGDKDWFAVELEANKTYRVDLEGFDTNRGTLEDPHLDGIYDVNAKLMSGTQDDNGGTGDNSRHFFTPEAAGTYYIAAGGNGSGTGTYRVSVTEIVDDYAADTNSSGAVVVGGTATGDIEYRGDRDWFAVTLEADKSYRFDLEGADSNAGTLSDPYLRGIHNAGGTLIADTTNDDGGTGLNSRLEFTTDAGGIYYVAAGGDVDHTGTYTLSVAEVDAI